MLKTMPKIHKTTSRSVMTNLFATYWFYYSWFHSIIASFYSNIYFGCVDFELCTTSFLCYFFLEALFFSSYGFSISNLEFVPLHPKLHWLWHYEFRLQTIAWMEQKLNGTKCSKGFTGQRALFMHGTKMLVCALYPWKSWGYSGFVQVLSETMHVLLMFFSVLGVFLIWWASEFLQKAFKFVCIVWK